MIGRHASEALDVSGGVDLGAAGHVGGIGGPCIWGFAGMELDQLPFQVQLDRGEICSTCGARRSGSLSPTG